MRSTLPAQQPRTPRHRAPPAAELGSGSHGKISEHLASCWARVPAMLEAGSPESLRRLTRPIADAFERLYRQIEEGVRQEIFGGSSDDALETECAELRAQRAALQHELTALGATLAAEQKGLQDEKSRAAGLDRQNHELSVRTTELQQRLADRERHLQMFGDQNDALTRLLSRAHTPSGDR